MTADAETREDWSKRKVQPFSFQKADIYELALAFDYAQQAVDAVQAAERSILDRTAQFEQSIDAIVRQQQDWKDEFAKATAAISTLSSSIDEKLEALRQREQVLQKRAAFVEAGEKKLAAATKNGLFRYILAYFQRPTNLSVAANAERNSAGQAKRSKAAQERQASKR